MTGENHEVQGIRLCINNLKRAEYRKNWKENDRKKKRQQKTAESRRPQTQTINETTMAKGMSLICTVLIRFEFSIKN